MARYIDADLIVKKLNEKIINSATAFINTVLIGLLKEAPTADVVEVKHGKWEDNGTPESVLSKCSLCGYSCGASTFNFCPKCGARMDGEKALKER